MKAGVAQEYSFTIRGNTINLTTKQATIKEILDASTQLGNIKVTVKDASGNPVPDASVTSTSQPGGQSTLSGVSGADGTITFSNLLLGSYSL